MDGCLSFRPLEGHGHGLGSNRFEAGVRKRGLCPTRCLPHPCSARHPRTDIGTEGSQVGGQARDRLKGLVQPFLGFKACTAGNGVDR